MIDVTIHFPDQAALVAFFTSKPAAPDVTVKDTSATVTPAKQEAARASTAAGKTEKAVAETKAADKPAEVKKTPTVDYPTLQKAVFDLVGAVKAKGLDPAVHVLGIAKQFGYDNFAKMKEAGPEGAMQFEPALAAVKAKAEEVAALVVEEAVA